MGRYEKSKGLAPPAVRKDIRAKHARHIVNKTIPAILASNTRARKGSESSELVSDPTLKTHAPSKSDDVKHVDVVKRKGQGARKVKRGGDNGYLDSLQIEKNEEDKEKATDQEMKKSSKERQQERRIRIMVADTLSAARLLQGSKTSKGSQNICILNMASPLRPGGGVLTGATSQEEFLCARTTLLPSLKEEYYRLPEFGGVWTSDVQVFRDSSPLNESTGELVAAERYWVDVISAGMLRFPELEGEDGEVKRLNKKDQEIVERKMRAVLLIAARKNVKKLILGAWGCGAYGNPVIDVARAWHKALRIPDLSNKAAKNKTNMVLWPDLEEVVFAISNVKMAEDFAQAFDSRIDIETSTGGHLVEDEEEGEAGEQDEIVTELTTKIEEMETQISQVWNPSLKTRMEIILDGLRKQLMDRKSQLGIGSEEETGEHSDDETAPDSSGAED